nr:MAG TPA: hypothetical protein [Caudoviricetes sp.]
MRGCAGHGYYYFAPHKAGAGFSSLNTIAGSR